MFLLAGREGHHSSFYIQKEREEKRNRGEFQRFICERLFFFYTRAYRFDLSLSLSFFSLAEVAFAAAPAAVPPSSPRQSFLLLLVRQAEPGEVVVGRRRRPPSPPHRGGDQRLGVCGVDESSGGRRTRRSSLRVSLFPFSFFPSSAPPDAARSGQEQVQPLDVDRQGALGSLWNWLLLRFLPRSTSVVVVVVGRGGKARRRHRRLPPRRRQVCRRPLLQRGPQPLVKGPQAFVVGRGQPREAGKGGRRVSSSFVFFFFFFSRRRRCRRCCCRCRRRQKLLPPVQQRRRPASFGGGASPGVRRGLRPGGRGGGGRPRAELLLSFSSSSSCSSSTTSTTRTEKQKLGGQGGGQARGVCSRRRRSEEAGAGGAAAAVAVSFLFVVFVHRRRLSSSSFFRSLSRDQHQLRRRGKRPPRAPCSCLFFSLSTAAVTAPAGRAGEARPRGRSRRRQERRRSEGESCCSPCRFAVVFVGDGGQPRVEAPDALLLSFLLLLPQGSQRGASRRGRVCWCSVFFF